MSSNNVALYLVVGVLVGYLLGRIDTLIKRFRPEAVARPKGFFPKQHERLFTPTNPHVEINDKKYVAPIPTDTLVKTTATELGETSVSADNINQSVSKLAQLKK